MKATVIEVALVGKGFGGSTITSPEISFYFISLHENGDNLLNNEFNGTISIMKNFKSYLYNKNFSI